jgi:hypothetical protein
VKKAKVISDRSTERSQLFSENKLCTVNLKVLCVSKLMQKLIPGKKCGNYFFTNLPKIDYFLPNGIIVTRGNSGTAGDSVCVYS